LSLKKTILLEPLNNQNTRNAPQNSIESENGSHPVFSPPRGGKMQLSKINHSNFKMDPQNSMVLVSNMLAEKYPSPIPAQSKKRTLNPLQKF